MTGSLDDSHHKRREELQRNRPVIQFGIQIILITTSKDTIEFLQRVGEVSDAQHDQKSALAKTQQAQQARATSTTHPRRQQPWQEQRRQHEK